IPEEKIRNQGNFYSTKNLSGLAFDHSEIISNALEFLRENLDNKIVSQFLPDFFPLNSLQTVHEIISQEKLDNRNFRKQILSSGFIRKINKIQKNVPHRPATLYQFVKKLS